MFFYGKNRDTSKKILLIFFYLFLYLVPKCTVKWCKLFFFGKTESWENSRSFRYGSSEDFLSIGQNTVGGGGGFHSPVHTGLRKHFIRRRFHSLHHRSSNGQVILWIRIWVLFTDPDLGTFYGSGFFLGCHIWTGYLP